MYHTLHVYAVYINNNFKYILQGAVVFLKYDRMRFLRDQTHSFKSSFVCIV